MLNTLKSSVAARRMANSRVLRLSILTLADLVIVALSYWAAFALRLESLNFEQFTPTFLWTVVPVAISGGLAFHWAGVYRQFWRFTSVSALAPLLKGIALSSFCVALLLVIVRGDLPFPRSIPLLFGLVLLCSSAGARIGRRVLADLRSPRMSGQVARERCFVYGAGAAGNLLARQVAHHAQFPFDIAGFIDDDASKVGGVLHGIRVIGIGTELAALAHRFNVSTVIVCMHAVKGEVVRRVMSLAEQAKLRVQILPEVGASLTESYIQPRKIDIADLLRRSPAQSNSDEVRRLLRDKVVLVTGAGGFIGSEICRQVFACEPKKIVMLDNCEFNLYRLEQEFAILSKDELMAGVGSERIVPILGSAANARCVDSVFATHKPTVVLHAAAYKHVPLVEVNPISGIENNIQATKVVLEAVLRNKVSHFLLISSDKAVKPPNVMGASKRCCEMLVQAHAKKAHAWYGDIKTGVVGSRLCAVRFGNVLGSTGSVVPKFLEQIKSGGPVTVTHPEVTRYFMLVSEAVSLVLQSLALTEGGEIFVLDMGKPVRIADMARQVVRLAGLEPDRDVKIQYTGLRPGEKLSEELLIDGLEQRRRHEQIYVTTPESVEPDRVISGVENILRLCQAEEPQRAVLALRNLIGSMPKTDSDYDVRISVPTNGSGLEERTGLVSGSQKQAANT